MNPTVQDLVRQWRGCERPMGWSMISACRARLFTAAVHTITAKAAENIPYDPMKDFCFLWANQWIQVAEGERKTIDDSLESLVQMKIRPASPAIPQARRRRRLRRLNVHSVLPHPPDVR